MIRLHLKVKFRAFFITFYTMDEMFDLPIPVPFTIPPHAERKIYSDHGVYLGVLVS